MQAKKEIVSVKAGDGCAESYPCQHEITIRYKDGTEEQRWANGRTIAREYGNYLDANDWNHFSGYAKSSFFGRSRVLAVEDLSEAPDYKN